MLYHCHNEPCRYFSPNLYYLRYHLEQCVFRRPDSDSPYISSPYSSPISTKRLKHEYVSEPIGSHAPRAGPCLSEIVSKDAECNVLEPHSFDRGLKQPSNSGSSHLLGGGVSGAAEKRDDMEQEPSFRKPEEVQSYPASGTVVPESSMHVETPEDLEPNSNELKISTHEDILATKQQDSEQEPCALELESDDPSHTNAELQDIHLDYMAVCLASVANSMGEKVADEIISALNHPFFDLNKFKKDVTSAHMCKERTNSIAKRYVGCAVRRGLKSVKTKPSEDEEAR